MRASRHSRALLRTVALIALAASGWSPAAAAIACHERPLIHDTCSTGFLINGSAKANDYIFPAGCQINLQREIHEALVRKGYRADMVGPYLGLGSIAAIQCEQHKSGLRVTGRLDAATIRQILGRDLLADRCIAAGLAADCPLTPRSR